MMLVKQFHQYFCVDFVAFHRRMIDPVRQQFLPGTACFQGRIPDGADVRQTNRFFRREFPDRFCSLGRCRQGKFLAGCGKQVVRKVSVGRKQNDVGICLRLEPADQSP